MNTTKHIHDNGEDRKLKDTFGNKMPYEVPDGYFEHLPTQILESISQKPARSLFVQRGLMLFTAAAAVFIIAALVITMVFTNRSASTEAYDEFSMHEIYQYNINNLADLEEAYLLSLIEDENSNLSDLMNIADDSISNDYMMEYLLAENHIEYHIINEY